MIKLLGCILIISASTAAGFILAGNMRKRLDQLRELQRSLLQLETEIVYTYTALPEACLKVSYKSGEPIKRLFSGVSEKLIANKSESVHEAFSDCISDLKDNLNLKKTDLDIILDLSKALGCSDMEGHKSVFTLAKHDLHKSIEEAEAIIAKNTKMYRYLGFSFGAVVAILLI